MIHIKDMFYQVCLCFHQCQTTSVNMVIFAGGKFRENVGKAFHVGVIFTKLLFSFINAYGFYFRVGGIFVRKTKARKTQKLPPRENFHVYSKGIERQGEWLGGVDRGFYIALTL